MVYSPIRGYKTELGESLKASYLFMLHLFVDHVSEGAPVSCQPAVVGSFVRLTEREEVVWRVHPGGQPMVVEPTEEGCTMTNNTLNQLWLIIRKASNKCSRQ